MNLYTGPVISNHTGEHVGKSREPFALGNVTRMARTPGAYMAKNKASVANDSGAV
jgi:hypothetical protein